MEAEVSIFDSLRGRLQLTFDGFIKLYRGLQLSVIHVSRDKKSLVKWVQFQERQLSNDKVNKLFFGSKEKPLGWKSTLPFYCEKFRRKLPTAELDEWIKMVLKLQRHQSHHFTDRMCIAFDLNRLMSGMFKNGCGSHD